MMRGDWKRLLIRIGISPRAHPRTPSPRYAGERAGERGERRVESRSARARGLIPIRITRQNIIGLSRKRFSTSKRRAQALGCPAGLLFFNEGGFMARSTLYRQVGSVRRSPVPRNMGSARSAGLTSSFGRMLAKLSLAGETLQTARPKRRR